MKIQDVMNRKVISINENTSPIEAFEKMYKNGIRRLFVINNNGDYKGTISYTNLIGILNNFNNENSKNNKNTIKNIMSNTIITIDAKEEIKNAANLMLRADISGLLVVDGKKPVGVITKTDICRLVAANLLIPNQ
ncbi:CBS domain-containing protein [Methanobrevibacter filiformis]|uniref:Inosine-5'-monophosphate dehydrogenase n=1 Tax=Methanobrevibacter filiformis TaxID=55758 RepID=A0A166BL58_9EURY|nr:CBS domain-containing protein [Methanobrevibacter filiformis]KZX13513.1 inosine-5'-monophosphate dehydrogenase [Methanobrevibacter filiformis]